MMSPATPRWRPFARSLRFVALTVLIVGCKSNSPFSMVKHEWGATRVEPKTSIAQPVDCQRSPELVQHDAYLERLKSYIALRNPATFFAAFAPERICVRTSIINRVNGEAYLDQQIVVLTLGLMDRAEADADVAMLMAHELANDCRQFKLTSRSIPQPFPAAYSGPNL